MLVALSVSQPVESSESQLRIVPVQLATRQVPAVQLQVAERPAQGEPQAPQLVSVVSRFVSQLPFASQSAVDPGQMRGRHVCVASHSSVTAQASPQPLQKASVPSCASQPSSTRPLQSDHPDSHSVAGSKPQRPLRQLVRVT